MSTTENETETESGTDTGTGSGTVTSGASYSSGTDCSDASLCPSERVSEPEPENSQNIGTDGLRTHERLIIWEVLNDCQKELEMLKEKIAENEAWKSLMGHFILSQFGFDIQKVLLEKESELNTKSSSIFTETQETQKRFDQDKKDDGDIDGAGPSWKYHENSKEDHDTDSYSRSVRLRSETDPDSVPDNNDTPSTKVPRYSPSVLYNNNNSESMQDTDTSWSTIPTFPLSDTKYIRKSISKVGSPSIDVDMEAMFIPKTELQGQEDLDSDNLDSSWENTFLEVTNQDVDTKIREVFKAFTSPGERSRVYMCKICNKSLTQKQNARLHVRRVHFGERLKCAGCSRTFYDRRCIANHKSTCTRYNQLSNSEEILPLTLTQPQSQPQPSKPKPTLTPTPVNFPVAVTNIHVDVNPNIFEIIKIEKEPETPSQINQDQNSDDILKTPQSPGSGFGPESAKAGAENIEQSVPINDKDAIDLDIGASDQSLPRKINREYVVEADDVNSTASCDLNHGPGHDRASGNASGIQTRARTRSQSHKINSSNVVDSEKVSDPE